MTRGAAQINRKRFNNFIESISEDFTPEQIDIIKTKLCKSMDFDPTAPATSKQHVARTLQWKHRVAEECGISIRKAMMMKKEERLQLMNQMKEGKVGV